MTVFNNKKQDHTKKKMFLDGDLGIQRYDEVKYRQFDVLTDKQLGFFWRPEEINLTKDKRDFTELSDHEKHIFTANLKRQILLDSVQGRAPTEAFSPLISVPELEAWVQTWTFMETIHSRSYTHIIRNVYPNPSMVFDTMLDIKEIIDCSTDISKCYDDLIDASLKYKLLGPGKHIVNGEEIIVDLYELKKKIWLTINSVNILEGIRFYGSFICSWAFGELKQMEGNSKIIKLICRDENLHLASTQSLLKILPKDDKDFAKIAKETKTQCEQMFIDAANQEKLWMDYIFKDGSMIGLNAPILKNYIEWITTKRMRDVGLTSPYKGGGNPIPWSTRWISGIEVQTANQETENDSYILGGTKQDVEEDTFKDFKI